MDSKDDSAKLEQIYRLLALCARAEGHPVFYQELDPQINQFTAWQELPSEAEQHGMGALLWYHIHQAGLVIPDETENILKGLYLRQRAINQTYAWTLAEIDSVFEENGIQTLVLKGLALAYRYYPDPALRHVSDIDLLLKQKDILTAFHLLSDAGFSSSAAVETSKRIPPELILDSPPRNGLSPRVELHHYDPKGKFAKGNSPDPEFEGFDKPPQAIKMGDHIIHTSTPMDTLLYLSRHLTKHLFLANAGKPLQLKWIADIVSLVEYHAEEFDWNYIRQNHKDILSRLELFYSMTPPPEQYADLIPLKRCLASPRGANRYPPGWPHRSIREWKRTGYLRFVFLVLYPPSDWWTRLYYGIDGRFLFWYKHIMYRLQILNAMFWVTAHRVGL